MSDVDLRQVILRLDALLAKQNLMLEKYQVSPSSEPANNEPQEEAHISVSSAPENHATEECHRVANLKQVVQTDLKQKKKHIRTELNGTTVPMQLDTASDTTLCAMNPDQHHESLGRCKTVLRAKNLEASSEPLGHTARTHNPQDNEAVIDPDQPVDLAVSSPTYDDPRTEPSDSVPGPDHRPSPASSDAIKLADTSSCANAGHLDPHPWLVALRTFRKLSTKIKHRISLTSARGLKNLAEGGKAVTDHPTNIAWLTNHTYRG